MKNAKYNSEILPGGPTVYMQFSSTLAPGGPPLMNSSTPYHQDLETKKDETILLSSGHIGDVDLIQEHCDLWAWLRN